MKKQVRVALTCTIVSGAAIAGAVGACVGSDPEPSTDAGALTDATTSRPAEDASDARPSTDGPVIPPAPDAGSDARVPTCAGQPFGAPVRVDSSQITAAIASTMWGPRVVGTTAIFAATPTGSNEQQIFRATYTPPPGGVGAPSLSNASILAPPSSTAVVEWAPTMARDNSFLVATTGFPLPRDLAVSSSVGGGAFGAAVRIAALSEADRDESDPYLVGAPTARALYFARDAVGGNFSIYRSAVTGPASFGPASRVVLACPLANCGTPVPTPNEALLMFGTWVAGGFAPGVQEAVLNVAGASASATGLVDHPELRAHYPSWVSDDGCEVLLGGGPISTVAEVAYARRAPK